MKKVVWLSKKTFRCLFDKLSSRLAKLPFKLFFTYFRPKTILFEERRLQTIHFGFFYSRRPNFFWLRQKSLSPTKKVNSRRLSTGGTRPQEEILLMMTKMIKSSKYHSCPIVCCWWHQHFTLRCWAYYVTSKGFY